MENNYYDQIDPEEIIEKLRCIINYLENKRKRLEINNAKEFSDTS